MNLLIHILLGVSIIYGDFSFCDTQIKGEHHITINNDKITENYIHVCSNTKDILFVTLHEMGHQFWNVYLSINDRNIFREMQTNNIDDYIRLYSMKSASEDFADIFGYIYIKKDVTMSQELKDKFEFVQLMIDQNKNLLD